MGAIEDFQALGPIPRKSLDRGALARFVEIIESDLFIAYSRSQATLDDATRSTRIAIPDVKIQARSLYLRHPRILAIQKTGISVLDLTARVIDGLFGALPGKLADVATELAYEFLDSRRRIVIYDASQTVKTIFLSNVARMIERRAISMERDA